MQHGNSEISDTSDSKAVSRLAFEVRRAKLTDFSFVLATWLRNYFNSSTFCQHMRPGDFFKAHHALVESYLARPGAFVLVACNPKDTDQIYGWAAFENASSGMLFHYMYVKPVFRRLGIGKALMPAPDVAVIVTHLTRSVASKVPEAWRYIPYLIGV